jgi:hypothetical protein
MGLSEPFRLLVSPSSGRRNQSPLPFGGAAGCGKRDENGDSGEGLGDLQGLTAEHTEPDRLRQYHRRVHCPGRTNRGWAYH